MAINTRSRRWGVPLVMLAVSTMSQAADPVGVRVDEGVEHQQVISVLQGQSKLLQAPWPVKRASVTDPTVADVEAITPDRLLILGRKIGTTDVFLWSQEEEIWRARLDVRVDLFRLANELAELFPESALDVVQSQDVVIVTGVLGNGAQADQLARFLEASEAATGLKYVDMTRLAGAIGHRAPTTMPAGGPPVGQPSFTPEALKAELSHLLPGSDLNVRQSQNVLVVTGLLRRAEQAEQLHAYLEALEESAEKYARAGQGEKDSEASYIVPTRFVDMTSLAGVQQVLLQVRMAEASRTAIRMLGINVLQPGHNDNVFFGAATVGSASGGALNPVNIGPAQGTLAGPENAPFTFNADVNVSPMTTLLLGFPRADLQFFIQALAENQYLRILAEPNLVALSGEEASFLAGGEFPIPVVQGGTLGSTSVTIEYKEFGVRLRFRPTVLGDNTIRLHLAPEVSDLSDQGAVEIQGFRVPSVITRRAETTLELNSGQTFMMAGLLSRRDIARGSRIPGIGDVPVIGSLFRSSRYEQGETEMVVLVSAWLAEPASENLSPPLPGVLHSPPDDWEFYAMGQIEGGALPKLSPSEAKWLDELGLNDLKGTGAWARYEQGTAPSRAALEPAPDRPCWGPEK